MNAAAVLTLQRYAMQQKDLEEVLALEQSVHSFPWSRGNFMDSLQNDHTAFIWKDARGELVAYLVAMTAVDEIHLLNISVARQWQGQGIGRTVFATLVESSLQKKLDAKSDAHSAQKIQSILLEVRPSNLAALRFYEALGFAPIGLRKKYYAAANDQREDAIVMRATL